MERHSSFLGCARALGFVLLAVCAVEARESRCADCHFSRPDAPGQDHGPDGTAPRAERAYMARDLYESVSVVRQELESARSFIERIDDAARRAPLEQAYEQAEVLLTEAINAGHRFVCMTSYGNGSSSLTC